MKLARFEGDASLEALAQRVLGDAAKDDPELIERLQQLNPHLQALDKLPRGTPVIVPGPEAAPDDDRTKDAVERLAKILEDAGRQREELFRRREQAIDAMQAITTRSDVGEAAKNTPALKDRLDAVAKELKARRSDVGQDRQQFAADVARIRTTLGIRGPKRRVVRT
jgi:hypothetical protein